MSTAAAASTASTAGDSRDPRPAGQPDLPALKTRQQLAWACGAYARIGTTLQIVGETLCEAMDLRAGQQVAVRRSRATAGGRPASHGSCRRGHQVRPGAAVPAARCAGGGPSWKPGKEGPFVIRLRFPAGFVVPPHRHSKDEFVTVMAGRFGIGTGRKGGPGIGAGAGTGKLRPPACGMPHYAIADVETIVQINGVGPFDVVYVDPKDDLRNR